jgi:DNA-binding winged helix-turn-helix (wHTH) protein
MMGEKLAPRYRFGVFEADASTGELRRQGIRVKLNGQPFQVLVMLLERPGELLTREEISGRLWPEGTFVDAEHGVNSAINRIREALNDTAASPRFVETLARRGYRFVAPVERIGDDKDSAEAGLASLSLSRSLDGQMPDRPQEPGVEKLESRLRILASPQELPQASHRVVRTFFVLLQWMYLGFYVGALANLEEIAELVSQLHGGAKLVPVLIVTAGLLIPARAFLLSATFFRAPGLRDKFLRLWPLLLPLDEIWALSPFLLLHHINFGLALSCTALLVYAPFAQRSLVLMGACTIGPEIQATAGHSS